MPAEFPKVSSGDAVAPNLTARWYNQVTHGVKTQVGAVPIRGQEPANQLEVMVKNMTGAAVERGHVLRTYFNQYDEATNFSLGRNRTGFMYGAVPVEEDLSEVVVVAAEQIAAGKIGRCVITGPAQIRLEIVSDEHQFAVPIASDASKMQTASDVGYPIIGKSHVKDAQPVEGAWAVVLLGGGNASTLTMLKGTAQSAVLATDASFTLVVSEVIFGQESAATVTVKNSFEEEFDAGDKLTVFSRQADGDYEPDRAVAGTGSQVVHYELTQDMALADTARLAKPVLANGTMDSGASAFYVVDQHTQFMGNAAYTDSIGSFNGYRGYALKFTDDWNATGVPGYRIISQEGPILLIAVTLGEDGQTTGTTTVLPLGDNGQEIYGNPFRGRYPAADSGTGAFECHDDYTLIQGAKQGDKWLVAYDEVEGYYNFLLPIVGPKYRRIRGKLKGSSVTRSSTSFIIDNVEAVDGTSPAASSATEITVSVPATAKVDIPSGATDWIYAVWNAEVGTDETDHWDCGDGANHYWFMRGHVGFSTTEFRLLSVEGNTEADMKWVSIVAALQELTGYVSGNNQSIGHDAGDTPEWQDDGSC